ncbi:hypothetical protein Tco_1375925 [Tanacetum coccineum]
MHTRSSFNLVGNSSSNPTTSNPKRRNRRRSKQPFSLEESPIVTMADQRTMAELLRLRAPTEVNQQTSVVTTAMTAILKQFQATPPLASIKAVEEICVMCSGAHPYYQCLTADGNTFPDNQDNIQGYIAAAAKMILRDGNERLTLNMRHDTSSYSTQPHQESINMIDVYNVSHEEILEDLFATNHPSGNPTSSLTSHTDLTSPEVNDDIFDPEGDIIENLLNLDKTKDLPPYHDNPLSGIPTPISEPVTKSSSSSPTLTSIEESDLIWEEFEAYLASDSFPPGNSNPSSPLPPFHNSLSGSTTSSSPSLPISETSDYSLEEFADELAHFTFPPGIDYLPFDAESDLREIEYLLNHDPIKEMDSILEDSVDKNSPDDNLVDTISEMFTDEHALDYSSPPLWDDYDDELFDLETVNDNTYDDPFDFKEEKIKESKLLIDELDLPGSSDFLPFLECDLVFYEDFSEVDALSSTNNEDKVFNPGILIHENLYEVTNCATMEKNVKKATNASLILEDFNPPLYELPF